MAAVTIDGVGSTLQQKVPGGFNFTGELPTNVEPTFTNGMWVYDPEVSNGGGLFVFDVDEPVFLTGLEFTVPGGGLTDWRFELRTPGEDPIVWIDGLTEQSFVLTEGTRLTMASSQTLAFVTNGTSVGNITVRIKAALIRPYVN